MKSPIFIVWMISLVFQTMGQARECAFKQPLITIHFGMGNIRDLNNIVPPNFERLPGFCPNDGYYSYTDYTGDCFDGHWFTLTEDHTPGDVHGNMMLVNAAYPPGVFLSTLLPGLKGGTTYEISLWLMNVCKVNSFCPFELLPNITLLLQTETGKSIAKFSTGKLARTEVPRWRRFVGSFTTPPSATSFKLTMLDDNPGGCGNDFALDDISVRECISQAPVITSLPKASAVTLTPKSPGVTGINPAKLKASPKKSTPGNLRTSPVPGLISKPQKDSQEYLNPVVRSRLPVLPPAPLLLTTRVNSLVKQIEAEAGEIQINLYDNGEIDGDTVSVYHNNVLLIAHAMLSQKPVSIQISIDTLHPHHELVMVAENLGSIPPNTSLMIITAGSKRYEVFISSTEEKNAKVVLDLKE